MNCEHCHTLLLDLLYDELDPAARREAEAHLEACPECAREFKRLKETQAAFRALPDPEVPAFLNTRIMAEAREQAQRPRSSLRWLLSPRLAMAAVAVIAVSVVLVMKVPGFFERSAPKAIALHDATTETTTPAAGATTSLSADETDLDKLARDQALPAPEAAAARAENQPPPPPGTGWAAANTPPAPVAKPETPAEAGRLVPKPVPVPRQMLQSQPAFRTRGDQAAPVAGEGNQIASAPPKPRLQAMEAEERPALPPPSPPAEPAKPSAPAEKALGGAAPGAPAAAGPGAPMGAAQAPVSSVPQGAVAAKPAPAPASMAAAPSAARSSTAPAPAPPRASAAPAPASSPSPAPAGAPPAATPAGLLSRAREIENVSGARAALPVYQQALNQLGYPPGPERRAAGAPAPAQPSAEAEEAAREKKIEAKPVSCSSELDTAVAGAARCYRKLGRFSEAHRLEEWRRSACPKP